MDFGIFYLDIQAILAFFDQPGSAIIFQVFALGGYLFFVWLLIYAGLEFYVDYRTGKNTANWKWVVLAVDVPALNVQTPKAVEQLFTHLAGALDHADIFAKYHGGFKQRWFSFEVISIGGYIQFLIRTEETFRDLVEAAIYAQYPDADVVEVEDYVGEIPSTFPNAEYDIWAGDFGLAEHDAYPIRTYREFEHNISKDTVLKDPMGAFLESFSRIGAGEQMWFQIIIEPTHGHWKEHAIEKIKEIIGDTSHSGHGGNKVLDFIHQAPMKLLENVGDQILGREAAEGGHDEHSGPPNQLQYLTPGQSKLVEAMEGKISKIGFKTKMRGVYIAKKEVFRPSRGVHALIGAISQFNVPTANSIVPKFTDHVSYFFHHWRSNNRKTLLMSAYKKRKIKTGGPPCVLNVEELATVWHFPMSHVKTPQVQKVEGKSAEPPPALPVEVILPTLSPEESKEKKRPDYGVDAGPYGDQTKFG